MSGSAFAQSPLAGVVSGQANQRQSPPTDARAAPKRDNSNASKDEPPAQDNSKPSDCTSNPVVLATGEKWKSESDFTAGGLYGLSLSRTYRSQTTRVAMFGAKWLSDYDPPTLFSSGCYRHPDYGNLCIPQTFTLTRPDGVKFVYTRTSAFGGLEYRVGSADKTGYIRYDPYGDIRFTRDKLTYTFSQSGNLRQIRSVSGPGGYLLQYTYGSVAMQPIRVTNRGGQTLEFTWTGDKVTTIRDTAGNTWTYTYHPTSGMLEYVTAPGPNADVRRYHYEFAGDSTLLTGISINGTRYSIYDYFTDKRVKESGLVGGEARDTFTYVGNTTTVTSASGQPTSYTFASVGGELKPVNVSRAATTSCPTASSAATAYDANGYTDYELDWKGNRTEYTFDPAGRLLDVTTASGSPVALKTINTWNGSELATTTLQGASGTSYRRISYTYHPASAGLAGGLVASETWIDLVRNVTRWVTYAYTFHPNGAMASAVTTRSLPTGTAVTTVAYDMLGNVISVTNPRGHMATSSGYNGLGLPGRVTDINGVATDFTWHANGNLLAQSTLYPTGARTTTYSYNNGKRPANPS